VITEELNNGDLAKASTALMADPQVGLLYRYYAPNKIKIDTLLNTTRMAKMTVIYRNPKNKELFDQHYFNVHIPLAKQLPGLNKYEISKGSIMSPTGHDETYLVANLDFDTVEDIKKAFASDVGQQCALDRRILAPGEQDVQIYMYDTVDV
jgi:uncharacterized protein (TIGR02118 family)